MAAIMVVAMMAVLVILVMITVAAVIGRMHVNRTGLHIHRPRMYIDGTRRDIYRRRHADMHIDIDACHGGCGRQEQGCACKNGCEKA